MIPTKNQQKLAAAMRSNEFKLLLLSMLLNYAFHLWSSNGNSSPRVINYDLRNMGQADSNEQLEYLLNIRKLIAFAVRELNKPLVHTDCVKWWANPLDLIHHEEVWNSDTHTTHMVRFYVQPGNIRFQVTIQQKFPPIDVNDVELEIVSSFEPLTKISSINCTDVPKEAQSTCLCSTSIEATAMEELTMKLRSTWNNTDRETFDCQPQQSFVIQDYLNFTDYDTFLTSPGDTKREVAENSYSHEYCGPNLKMLIMICSNPFQPHHRQVIRNTFGSRENLEGKQVKLLFYMGIPTNETQQASILKESAEYKDIIEESFLNSYHNLTLSHLSMYKWAYLTCGAGKIKGVTVPKHILKADDDFFLNIDLALRVAQENPEAELIGCAYCGTKPVRDPNYMVKYYTPRYMHISDSYAGYLSGVAYIMRTDIIPRLLHMSTTTPIIHQDDVYVTGILPRRLLIYPRDSRLFGYGRVEPDACKLKLQVTSFTISREDMTEQYQKFIEPAPENCSLDVSTLKVQQLRPVDKKLCLYGVN